MECKFTVGQKVVCIDNNFHPEWNGDGSELKLGGIYTINEIYIRDNVPFPLVKLKEVQTLGGWVYKRFAPLNEKKTDISVFESIVNKINVGDHENNYGFCLDELFETVKK